MTCDIYLGRNTTLCLQLESAFRQLPVAPAALGLGFTKASMNRGAIRQEDATIRANPLMEKRDEVDEKPEGSVTAKLNFNEAGVWLQLLLGAPTTTALVGGLHQHVYTLDLKPRPSAVIEMVMKKATGAGRQHRYLGASVDTLEINPLANDASLVIGLLFGYEQRPEPVAAFDATPTVLDVSNAISRTGLVYDVLGASTLGEITDFKFKFENDLTGYPLADGLPGNGCIVLGQPKLTGSLSALMDDGTILDHARQHLSKPIRCLIANAAGNHSLTLDVPAAEFDEQPTAVETSKGLVIETQWMAHRSSTPVTLTLINSVAGYSAP